MQIKSVGKVSSQHIQKQQNFKGNSANSGSFSNFIDYQSNPLNMSKAYTSPQVTNGYREIGTFDVPYIGKGKLYELANGHKVIIVPKASKTHISTIVGVGFSDESVDKKEIAHLTEHLLANYWYNASSNSVIAKILKETGASTNAATKDYSTSYYTSANVQDNNDLENLIKMQVETLTNNTFNENDIEKEKNIIIEEAKENGYFIKPDILTYDESVKNLFNLSDTNGFVAERNIQKITNIRREDLEKFYNNFYHPDNMSTIIIGNVDDNSIKIISKYLNKMSKPNSTINRSNTLNIKDFNFIKQPKRSDIESRDKSNNYWSFTNLSFIGPTISDIADTENLMVLSKVIKNRLKQQNINFDVEIPSTSNDKNIPQIISINGKALDEKTENNIKSIYETIGDLLKNQVSESELDKAKEQVFDDLSDKLEDNDSLTGFLNDMLLSNSRMDIKSFFNQLRNVSKNDIQSTTKKYLDLNKASLVVVHPKTKETNKSNALAFKGLSKLTNTKDIKEYDLPNNLHVIFDSRPGIVKTAVSCNFVFEDKNKNNRGIIDAMQTSLVINENEEFPAGNWLDYDGIHIRKNGSSENVQKIIEDVKSELINAEFRNNKLEKAKERQKENLQLGKNVDPFNLLLENDYLPKNASEICPDWVTTNDLKRYYNYLLSQAQGTIVVTIPREKLAKVETDIINSLAQIPTVKPHNFSKILDNEMPTDLDKTRIFLNKQGASDTVRLEKEFKIVNNENIHDEVGIMLISLILNEKLEKSLRTNSGLVYSASSFFSKSSPKRGVLDLSTEVAKAPLEISIRAVLVQMDNIVNDLINSEVDVETLNSIKKQLKSDILFPAETSVDRNMSLASDYIKTYDIDYSKKMSEAIDDITNADLKKIAQKYLTKHYLLEISGNEKSINSNRYYLSSLGEIINK